MGEENNFETTENEVMQEQEVLDRPMMEPVNDSEMDIETYSNSGGGGLAAGAIGIIGTACVGGFLYLKHKKAKKAAEDAERWQYLDEEKKARKKKAKKKPKVEEEVEDEVIDPEEED